MVSPFKIIDKPHLRSLLAKPAVLLSRAGSIPWGNSAGIPQSHDDRGPPDFPETLPPADAAHDARDEVPADARAADSQVAPRGYSGEFRSGLMLLVAVALLLALAAPFLGGHVNTADDLGAFHLPLRAFYANCFAHGVAFDWSPQLFGGFYLTGEGQLGGYHPLHLLLYRLLPLNVAFDIECLAAYPFMLLGMFLLLRRWGCARDAALFGGVTFAFSGFSLLHFVHVNGVAVVAHLPWLLLAIHAVIDGASRNRRLAGGIGIALLTGSQLLLGYPQYVWLSFIAELGYALLTSCAAVPKAVATSRHPPALPSIAASPVRAAPSADLRQSAFGRLSARSSARCNSCRRSTLCNIRRDKHSLADSAAGGRSIRSISFSLSLPICSRRASSGKIRTSWASTPAR